MKRLNNNNINTPEEYDKIFAERSKKAPHWQDVRRWKELIKYFKGGYIVDIGCLDSKVWDYVHSKFWKEQNYRYLGTDMAEECIKEMAKTHPYANSKGEPLCSFIVDDLYKSNTKDGIADYLIMGEILEHLSYPAHAIEEAFKKLKPGGILAISVPLNEAIEPGAVDGERHLWSYDKEDIRSLVSLESSKVKIKVLRSKWFPKYHYCFPQLIAWCWKK